MVVVLVAVVAVVLQDVVVVVAEAVAVASVAFSALGAVPVASVSGRTNEMSRAFLTLCLLPCVFFCLWPLCAVAVALATSVVVVVVVLIAFAAVAVLAVAGVGAGIFMRRRAPSHGRFLFCRFQCRSHCIPRKFERSLCISRCEHPVN